MTGVAMWPYVLIILLSVFISSISQAMLKKAALKTYPNIIKEYLNPQVITAYIMFFATTILVVVAYKGIPLSLGPILETTAYLYITLFGIFIFHEKLSALKIAALGMIVLGILLFALG